jgi:hypothetical protein
VRLDLTPEQRELFAMELDTDETKKAHAAAHGVDYGTLLERIKKVTELVAARVLGLSKRTKRGWRKEPKR